MYSIQMEQKNINAIIPLWDLSQNNQPYPTLPVQNISIQAVADNECI